MNSHECKNYIHTRNTKLHYAEMSKTSSGRDPQTGRDCGPCSLCDQERVRYLQCGKLNKACKDKLIELDHVLPDKACICTACVDNIKKNMGNTHYKPRWQKHTVKCSVPTCTSNSKVMHVG